MRTVVKSVVTGLLIVGGSPFLARAGDVGGGETLVVTPTEGRVGQKFDIECKGFPEPAPFDSVYVVASGTPDINPMAIPAPKEKILWFSAAQNCYPSGRFLFPAGPFASGSYEVRFVTTLYNNDKRYETSTRTTFIVR